MKARSLDEERKLGSFEGVDESLRAKSRRLVRELARVRAEKVFFPVGGGWYACGLGACSGDMGARSYFDGVDIVRGLSRARDTRLKRAVHNGSRGSGFRGLVFGVGHVVRDSGLDASSQKGWWVEQAPRGPRGPKGEPGKPGAIGVTGVGLPGSQGVQVKPKPYTPNPKP